MTKIPAKLTREETLALVSALILTTILCVYSLYLKQQELAETSIVSLFEYAESSDVPGKLSVVPRHKARQAKREFSLPTKGAGIQIGGDGSSSGDTTTLTHPRSIVTSDSLSRASGTISDSISIERSVVFRPCKRSWELDSILTMPGEPGVALLRQHVIYESRAYDTAITNHLIRSAKELAQVDVSPTLETQMKFNVGRYGLPYNPLRPQPPSPQVKLRGFVTFVLDFLYTQAKEVPAAVTRVIKPRDKKIPE
ncbi:MAG: hypothetical protein NTZ35_08200 [Ignavibacteriales bacterium]|nr:hypothetical protein [Ignavibacteriales bacterium]